MTRTQEPPQHSGAPGSGAGVAAGTGADAGTAPELDLLISGPLFFDLVLTGLPHAPRRGTETWAAGMGTSPGGVANLAVAAARLGLRTGLSTAFGDDAYADWLWEILGAQEQVDLSTSWRLRHWHTAVTVSMAYDGERTMVSHGHAAPPRPAGPGQALPVWPRARAVVGELGPNPAALAAGTATEPWWAQAAAQGALVFVDGGWDPTGAWDPAALEPLRNCYAFTPNEVEALSLTRAATAEEAVKELAKHAPLAVVTCGARGAVAVDPTTGELVGEPALHVDAIDTTGAGDVFAAALVHGTMEGWDLRERLRLAALCSALAVQHFGGALAAPGWGDIADWWTQTVGRARTGDADARTTADRYEFLTDALPHHELRRVRRAEATMARSSDAQAAAAPLSGAIPVLRG